MDKFTYEIDADGAVLIFVNGNTIPSIYQPYWQDGVPFIAGEAEAWAKATIAYRTGATDVRPGVSSEMPTLPPIETLDLTFNPELTFVPQLAPPLAE